MILFTAIDPQTNHLIIGRGTGERGAADDLLARMADYAACHAEATCEGGWRINFEPAEQWS